MQQDPSDPSGTKFTFNPWVLVLSYEKAELLVNSEPAGRGKGVLSLRFP